MGLSMRKEEEQVSQQGDWLKYLRGGVPAINLGTLSLF